jgi:serine/threonine-protein phosphatase 2A activator
VWGLDDYQFLPFLFGAAELDGNQEVPTPDDGIRDINIERYGDKYMYLSCIQYIIYVDLSSK